MGFYQNKKKSFSQRNGMVAVREKLQVDEFDEGTRNVIWNEVLIYLKGTCRSDLIVKRLRLDVFEFPIDSSPTVTRYEAGGIRRTRYVDYSDWIKKRILVGDVSEVLDIVEYLTDQDRADEWGHEYGLSRYGGLGEPVCALPCEKVDDLFAGMCVGYRFVKGVLCRVVSEEAIKAIESAINESPDAVAEQLNKALLAFADREHPNYANSVKEAISAVESQCCILTGDPKASLGEALKKLESTGVKIHPALNKALHQLYGYTSDDPGIRHGGIETANVDAPLAQFMLVSCSAFVNYLRTVKMTIGG